MSERQFGHCGTCRFTRPCTKEEKYELADWGRLVCLRFPPRRRKTVVGITDGCWEWQQRETDEVKT